MKKTIIVLLAVLLSTSILAGDLYFVNINSKLDANIVNSIDCQPLIRTSDGVVILIEAQNSDQLLKSVLTYQIITSNIERSEIFLDNRKDRNNTNRFDLIYEKNDIRMYRIESTFDKSLNLSDIRPLSDKNAVVEYEIKPEISASMLSAEDVPLLDLINLVDEFSMRLQVMNLSKNYPFRRGGTSSNENSRIWLESLLAYYGYDSLVTDTFTTVLRSLDTVLASNIIATKVGTVKPEYEIIVCAHRDAVQASPGADDNGSGTIGVLEIARILKNIDTDMTIKFMLFDAEEDGLLGSSHYVEEANIRGDSIVAVFNMDMIGAIGNTNEVELFHGYQTRLANLWIDLADSLIDYQGYLSGTSMGSDHFPFQQSGYEAIFVSEMLFSTVYHTVNDTYEYMDFTYMANNIRITLAAVYTTSQVAGPTPILKFSEPLGAPEMLSPLVPEKYQIEISSYYGGIPDPSSALLHYAINNGEYLTIPMSSITPFLYETYLPIPDCYEGIKYYFSIVEQSEGVILYTDTIYPNQSIVADSMIVHFEDNFESDLGWDKYAILPSSGYWQRGVPVGPPSGISPVHDGDGSGQCYVTNNNIYSYLWIGSTALESPPFRLEFQECVISYYYFLYMYLQQANDMLRVEITDTNDDSNWRTIRIHNSNIIGPYLDWRQEKIYYNEIEELGLNMNADLRIRYIATSDSYISALEAGIDGFKVESYHCDTINVHVMPSEQIGEMPLTVSFDNSTDYTPITWLWDFGDGGTSTDPNPSHIYTGPGVYNVRVDIEAVEGNFFSEYLDFVHVTADTISIGEVAGDVYDTVSVAVNLHNYVPIKKLTIPVKFSGEFSLTFLWAYNTGLRSENMNLTLNRIDNFNRLGMMTLQAPYGEYLNPGTGNILNLIFRIGTNASEGDTTEVIFWTIENDSLFFTTSNGDYVPQQSTGLVYFVDGGCCEGIRGNADNDLEDLIDIGDIVYMVEHQFSIPAGPEPICFEEADINGDLSLDIEDIVLLVEYQFSLPPGPAPESCP